MYLLQDDPSSGVPWGRPSVPTLPVPPFRDERAARSFVAQLCAYVALLGGDDPVDPTTFALLTTVQREVDQDRSARTFRPLPSPHLLTLAMVTYFPAPWTVDVLSDVIHQVLEPDDPRARSTPGSVSWGMDPHYTATRSAAGEWEVNQEERGTRQLAGHFANDDDMVLYRLSFARSHPMPFGWSWDRSEVDSLAPAAEAARAAWAPHAELPTSRSGGSDGLSRPISGRRRLDEPSSQPIESFSDHRPVARLVQRG